MAPNGHLRVLHLKMQRGLAVGLLGLVLGCAVWFPPSQTAEAPAEETYPFQERLLAYIQSDSLPTDESWIYYWPRGSGDTIHLGTTRPIDYLGSRLSDVRDNRGTHCVGVSWQICMSVLQEWADTQDTTGQILDMTVEDMRKFIDMWFIKLDAPGDLATLSIPVEMGSVYALSHHGLGYAVSQESARPGDFVQFWRTDGSGHSCIFLDWVYDQQGNTIGFHYWGSQPQTDGIGTDTEYFSSPGALPDTGRLVRKNRFYVGRLLPKRR